MARPIKIKINGDASNLKKEVGKAKGMLGGLGGSAGKLAGVMATAFAAREIGQFVGSLYTSGQELEQWRVKAETVFEDHLGVVSEWADANNEAFGMTDEALLNVAASTADLLKPMGFTAEAAVGMAQEVVGLSGALSNWTGGTKSAADVADILNKAVLGEREGLKTLGISILQAEVDTRALTLAKADGRDEITQMDKALATQALIMEKSTDAQAAWADGGEDAALRQNSLKVTMMELKETIASNLLPVFNRLTVFANEKLIPALGLMAEKAKSLWADTLRPLASKIKTKLVAAFESLRDTFVKQILPALLDVKDSAVELWVVLEPWIVLIGEELVGAVKALYDAFAEDGLKGVLDLVLNAAKPITDWMERNQPIMAGIATVIIAVLVPALFAKAAALYTAAAGWLAMAAGVIAAAAPFAAIVVALGLVVAGLVWAYQNVGWFRTAVDAMKDAAVVAFNWLKDNVPPILSGIVDVLVAVWDASKDAFNWLKDNVPPIFEVMFTAITKFITFTLDMIAAVWGIYTAVFNALADIVILFTNLPGKVKDAAVGVFDSVSGAMTTAYDWVVEKIDAIVTFVTELPARIATASLGAFDGIWNAFKGVLSSIQDAWNAIDPTINLSIPGWVPLVGGKRWDSGDIIPDISIPGLQSGGTLTRSGTVMVGEAGPEFLNLPAGAEVRPLERGDGSGAEIVVNVQTDADPFEIGQELAWAYLTGSY